MEQKIVGLIVIGWAFVGLILTQKLPFIDSVDSKTYNVLTGDRLSLECLPYSIFRISNREWKKLDQDGNLKSLTNQDPTPDYSNRHLSFEPALKPHEGRYVCIVNYTANAQEFLLYDVIVAITKIKVIGIFSCGQKNRAIMMTVSRIEEFEEEAKRTISDLRGCTLMKSEALKDGQQPEAPSTDGEPVPSGQEF